MMMTSRSASAHHDASPGGILNLIRTGVGSSRADIARATGLAPSTVTVRVDWLIRNGFLRDAGPGASSGGRRPKHLEVDPDAGAVLGVGLGARHASFGLFNMAGDILATRHLDMDIADGPQKILPWIAEEANAMLVQHAPAGFKLRGIGLGLPGPVESPSGRLIAPSRMPGWNGIDAATMLAEVAGVPALADNDANLMALGEHVSLSDNVDQMAFVMAGSSIGCGIIASGRLFRGHRGMAGDISHVSVPNAPRIVCSCGRVGCLDVVAGGAAIVASLRAAGVAVTDSAGALKLAEDGHPLATQMLREAGTRTGGVLATIINFFNPQRLVLGGSLSGADAYVAGVRSAIYTECLPLATDDLEITVTSTKELGGIIGAAQLILDHIFDPRLINESLI